jgi:hypothetical protein
MFSRSAVRDASGRVQRSSLAGDSKMPVDQTQSKPAAPEAGPESAQTPIKHPEPSVDSQPEIPKVGSADAPGG